MIDGSGRTVEGLFVTNHGRLMEVENWGVIDSTVGMGKLGSD